MGDSIEERVDSLTQTLLNECIQAWEDYYNYDGRPPHEEDYTHLTRREFEECRKQARERWAGQFS